jgi:hypothetical protein
MSCRGHVSFGDIVALLKGLRQGQGRHQGGCKKNGLHVEGLGIWCCDDEGYSRPMAQARWGPFLEDVRYIDIYFLAPYFSVVLFRHGRVVRQNCDSPVVIARNGFPRMHFDSGMRFWQKEEAQEDFILAIHLDIPYSLEFDTAGQF